MAILEKLKYLAPNIRLFVPSALTIAIGLGVPLLDGRYNGTADTYDATYQIEDSPGRLDTQVNDLLQTRQNNWTKQDRRPWLRVLSGPAITWTRFEIPPYRDGVADVLVAHVNFPMHRDIAYYLIEDGKVIDELTEFNLGSRSIVKEPRTHKLQSTVILDRAFAFEASPNKIRYLIVRSTIFGVHAPRPEIQKLDSFLLKNQSSETLVAVIFGAAALLIIYNVIVGIVLGRLAYLYLALFLLGLSVITMLVSGFVERLIPALAYDQKLYSLICAELVVLASIAILLLRQAYIGLALDGPKFELDDEIRFFLAVGVAVVVPWINAAARPGILSLLIVGAFGYEIYLSWANRHVLYLRKYFYGVVIFELGLMISILAWYQIIDPHLVRLIYFEICAIATAMDLLSMLTLRMSDELAAFERLKTQIKDKARRLIASTSQLASDPNRHEMHATDTDDLEEAEICVVFIDIVAFSQMAAPLPSRQVFEQLSRRLAAITAVIHEYGGNIDRSLGDGVLCFFGYRSDESPQKYAERAFAAAIKIQELTVSSTLESLERGDQTMIMPVRIGIHTSSLIMGNLGGGTRIDYTMIGAGVNFASRLETACTPFKVLISDRCHRDLISLGHVASDFTQVAVTIKHKDDHVVAYEYDPFRTNPQRQQQVERAFFEQLGLHAADKRLKLEKPGSVILESKGAEFVLNDISLMGLRATSSKHFGRQSKIQLRFRLADQDLLTAMQFRFVDIVTVEVRWSRPSPQFHGQFEHGFKVLGASIEQRQYLLEQIGGRYALQGEDANRESYELAVAS